MDVTEQVKECVRRLGGANLNVTDDGTVDFEMDEIPGFAYAQPGGRLRGTIWIHVPYEGDGMSRERVLNWVDRQEDLRSARLEAFPLPDDEEQFAVRVLFERPLDPQRIASDDPLKDEASALFYAWPDDGVAREPKFRTDRTFCPEDPAAGPPKNAWMLFGAEPIDGDYLKDLRSDAALGIFEGYWTAAKQTEPGDLLFLYLTAPHKAIRYVMRAANSAYFADIGEHDDKFTSRQWWCHIAPPVEIEPITLSQLEQVVGKTVMSGKSGRYVRPEHAAALAALARPAHPRDQALLDRILQPATGRADHPDPSTMTLEDLSVLAAGSLPLEENVEHLIVEPLLRFLTGDDPALSVQRRLQIGRRIADYAVLRDGAPAFVVETKLRIRHAQDGRWSSCKDLQQLRDYATTLSVPGLLVDAVELHVVLPEAQRPVFSCNRRDIHVGDLADLRHLLLGS